MQGRDSVSRPCGTLFSSFQQCFQPLEDHCRLGPGGGAGRIQRAVGPALEQSGRHRPGQGLPA